MNKEVIAHCPKCDAAEIGGYDTLVAIADVVFVREGDGTITEDYTGGSEVVWDTQEAFNKAKPFHCGNCGELFALSELRFVEEGEPRYVVPARMPSRDDLTIAYLAMGAKAALMRHNGLPEGYCGGEIEFIGAVTEHAKLLDEAFLTHFGGQGFPGVYAYEIVEPFGEAWAEAMYTSPQEFNAIATLDRLLAEVKR